MSASVSQGGIRLCFVSTYSPQRCGIATYTAALAEAISRASGETPSVLAEIGAAEGAANGVHSLPVFERRGDYVPALVAAARQTGVRLIHVEHAPDILGIDERLPRLLEQLRAIGVVTVVTLHTVHTPASGALERRFGVKRFHRRLGQTADAIVVHGDRQMADELVRQGVPADKVHVIAHGTTVHVPPGRTESRHRLGLPADGPLLLYFGFIHIQKNVHTILRALARLRRSSPDVHLLIAGSIQNRAWYNRLYWWVCQRLMSRPALLGRVTAREGFVAAEDIPYLYGAADLVLLPYAQGYGSASGVVHSALGAGRLMLCSIGPKFLEIGERLSPDMLVPAHDPEAWARRIEALLGDEAERHALTDRVTAYAQATAWPQVARQHLDLYERLGRAREGGGSAHSAMSRAAISSSE
jgi:glycosyltransferase involved in cell wall biosynthesis